MNERSGPPRPRAATVVLLLAATTPCVAHAQTGEAPTELEEIVVERDAEPESDLPLGLGVGGETLRTTPGSGGDPLRSLQTLPGFVFTDDENAAPAVRGSRPGDNLVQVDFVPGGYLFHAGGIVSVFNAELIEAFDLYPSAYGPEFAGVTGGVFDIRLRDPKTDRFHATIDVNVLQAGALVEGPVAENQSFYLAGRISYLDLLVEGQLDDEDGVTFVQFPKYTDYQGKYVWTPTDGTTLRAQIDGATDELEILLDESAEDIELEPIFAGRNAQSTRYDRQSLVWEQETDADVRVRSALSHSTSASDVVAGSAGNVDVAASDLLLKSHASVPVGSSHELSFGASVARVDTDYRLSVNDPGCTEFEPECRVTGAERLETEQSLTLLATRAFVRDAWYASDALTLYPGLAFQSEDYLDEAFLEPRVALEYELVDGTLLSAGTGLYHQFPGVDVTDEVFGNPELDYVRSVQALVGLQRRFGARWDLKTELWYKDLDDLISGDEERRYVNGGEGHAFGLDLLLRADVTERLSGWFSLALSEARRENAATGERFAFEYDQPFNATLVGSYVLSPNWKLGGKLWVHSGAPYTEIVGSTPNEETEGLFDPIYGPLNGARLPSYARLDLRADRTFRLPSGLVLDAYLEVLNVLDADNLSYYDYNADYSERRRVTQLPRIAGIGVTARF